MLLLYFKYLLLGVPDPQTDILELIIHFIVTFSGKIKYRKKIFLKNIDKLFILSCFLGMRVNMANKFEGVSSVLYHF